MRLIVLYLLGENSRMAQLRLTKKFATDMKVSKLELPSLVTAILDDWFIDIIRVQRKKVAMVTHAKSLLTFLLPYEKVGGAKFVPDAIAVLLKKFLKESELNVSEEQINQIFSISHVFCKTDNRKVLGHMNDFKRCIEVGIHYDGLSFDAIKWDDIMHSINNMPIGTQDYKYATEIAAELFSELTISTTGKLI